MSLSKLKEMDPEKKIDMAALKSLTGMSAATIYRRINQGSIPRPDYLRPRKPIWRAKHLVNWIESSGTTETSASLIDKRRELREVLQRVEGRLCQKDQPKRQILAIKTLLECL